MSILSEYWGRFQVALIPHLENALESPLTPKLQLFVQVLDIVDIARFIPSRYDQRMGRKAHDRRSIARAFIAKAVYDLPTTELLIEFLLEQPTLRKLCGFDRRVDVPSASTFSRAFAKFATNDLGSKVHESIVRAHGVDKIVMHISRDSTAVSAREKATKKEAKEPKPKRNRGRPKKGEEVEPKEQTRIEQQLTQTAEEALAELSKVCNVGAKRDSKGNSHYWTGWKAHIDWADGSIPLNVVTTSASVHDSQVAIPLARVTARRVHSCYDLMDAAYDVKAIRKVSEELGHVPIIDVNKRGGELEPVEGFRALRYNERSTAERGNSRLKDAFGLRHLRVRGHAKAHFHIMLGVLVLFADQLYKVPSG